MRLTYAIALLLMIPSLAGADERVRQWQADVVSLRDQLALVHPRFAACGLNQDLRDRFAELSANIGVLDDAQITVRMQAILAAVGDGHTLLWPFGMSRGQLLRLPIQLWSFDDGLFVVRSSDGEAIGRRVVRVGSLSSDELMRRLAPFVSHDNDMQLRWAAPLYATFTDFLVAAGAISDRTRAVLTFDDGRTMALTAVPVEARDLDTKLPPPPHSVAMYLSRRDDAFWHSKLPDGTVYVQLNAIDDADNHTLAQFGRELRAVLDKTDRAILDLRLNNGGDARKANELLKTLIAYDVNRGRLAVLTSRITFSAAQTLATRLQEWTTASFIGEATGSRPNHYGNERPFKLPHSQIRGTIASGLNQPITAHDDRVTITPDLAVPWCADDYFSGRDPALDAAVELLSH